MRKSIFLYLLFLVQLAEDRKINVGGINRGSSAARTNSAGYRPNTGGNQPYGGYHPQQGGYHPQQGGYHPQANYPPHDSNYHQPSNFHPNQGYNQPRFNPGTGPGSVQKTNTFRNALIGGALGAAGGIATYELGKAILHSSSLNVHGQPYYFGEQNYQNKPGYFMCSMPLSELAKQAQTTQATAAPSTDESGNTVSPPVSTTMSPEQFFATVQFKDGTRPKSLTWSCKTGSEVCCGTECCPAPQQDAAGSAPSRSRGPPWLAIIFGILAGIGLLICCCCCLAYKLCRSAFDMCLPSSNNNAPPTDVVYSDHAPSSYDNIQAQYGGQAPSYPAYTQGGYPPAQGYNYPNQQSYAPQY